MSLWVPGRVATLSYAWNLKAFTKQRTGESLLSPHSEVTSFPGNWKGKKKPQGDSKGLGKKDKREVKGVMGEF